MPIVPTDSHRLRVLMEMVRALSQASSPGQVLQVYSSGMSQLDEPSAFVSLSLRDVPAGSFKLTRLLPADESANINRIDSWDPQLDLPIQRGGLLSELIDRGEPTVMHQVDLSDDPVLGEKLGAYRSLMAVPLLEAGEPLNWALLLRQSPYGFESRELEDMLIRGNLVGNTVRHVLTAQRLTETETRSRAQVDRIGQIQRALLPQQAPKVRGINLAATYQPYDRAGGDMYSFRRVGADPLVRIDRTTEHDGAWGLFVADVSGHGAAAAVIMAMLETILSTGAGAMDHDGDLLGRLNQHLVAKSITESFVTAVSATWYPDEGRLSYARAGHPPPLWRHFASYTPGMNQNQATECVDSLDAVNGLPLGILADERYELASVQLEPGDTVAMYTDGVSETRDPDGLYFGVDGVKHAMARCSGEAQCLIDTLNYDLGQHLGGRPAEDDVTVVALQVAPQP